MSPVLLIIVQRNPLSFKYWISLLNLTHSWPTLAYIFIKIEISEIPELNTQRLDIKAL